MAKTVKWGSVRVSRGVDLGVALGVTGLVVLWAMSANRRAARQQAVADEIARNTEQLNQGIIPIPGPGED